MQFILASVAAGLICGAVEGGLRVAWAVPPMLYGAGLNGVLAGLIGAILWSISAGVRRFAVAPRLAAKWHRVTSRDAIERGAVIAFHARVTCGILGLAGFFVAETLVIQRAWRLEVESFAIALSSTLIVVLAAVAAVAAYTAVPFFDRLFAKIDTHLRLPFPPQPSLRYLLFVVAPIWALGGTFLWRHQTLLGARPSSGLWYVMVAATAPAIALAWRNLKFDSRLPKMIASVVVVALAAGSLGYTIATFRPRSRAARVAHNGPGSRLSADLLRAVSDVDRDGSSGILGGGDCAPWDGARGPKVKEIAGNGVDEDCDGRDPPAQSAIDVTPTPQFSNSLAPGNVRHYNIVWVTADAMRADRIHAYGYRRATTPYFDRLAKESLLFENVYSQSSRTFFSVPSMFLGELPGLITWKMAHGVQQPVQDHVSIAETLKAAGYRTGLLLPGGMKKQYTGLQQGFVDVVTYFLDKHWKQWKRKAAPSTTTKAIELLEHWLNASRDKPFFLAAHYIDPHNPYTTHPKMGLPQFGGTASDRYDHELAYTDRYIGFLIDYLRHKPALWDNTIIIITSDHGEEFHEHGNRFHGRSCHVESSRVPLLVRIPGVNPKRVTSAVALVDIVPTLIEATGLSSVQMSLNGQSLLVPASRATMPPRPIFCTTASSSGRSYLRRSVRLGKYALLQDIGAGTFSLFDTKLDPKELNDLWSAAPSEAPVSKMKDLLGVTAAGNLKSHW